MTIEPIDHWWEKPVRILSMERLDEVGHAGGWLEIGGEARYYSFSYEILNVGAGHEIGFWNGDDNFSQYMLIPGPGFPRKVFFGIGRAIIDTVEGKSLTFPIDLSEFAETRPEIF